MILLHCHCISYNQFCCPAGSSIALVYEDSFRMLSHVLNRGEQLAQAMSTALLAAAFPAQVMLVWE